MLSLLVTNSFAAVDTYFLTNQVIDQSQVNEINQMAMGAGIGLVGDPNGDSYDGKVYSYSLNIETNTFNVTQTITPPIANQANNFGVGVAISGDNAVIVDQLGVLYYYNYTIEDGWSMPTTNSYTNRFSYKAFAIDGTDVLVVDGFSVDMYSVANGSFVFTETVYAGGATEPQVNALSMSQGRVLMSTNTLTVYLLTTNISHPTYAITEEFAPVSSCLTVDNANEKVGYYGNQLKLKGGIAAIQCSVEAAQVYFYDEDDSVWLGPTILNASVNGQGGTTV